MIPWWRRRRQPETTDTDAEQTVRGSFNRRGKTIYVQFDMRVLNRAVPMEIEGTCNQRPFYYRARHERWSISPHVVDHANGTEPIASGECDIDQQSDLAFALDRIYEHLIAPALDV